MQTYERPILPEVFDDVEDDRWAECDTLEDEFQRMSCRISRLNDFAHRTDRRLGGMVGLLFSLDAKARQHAEWQAKADWRLKSVFWASVLGAVTSVGKFILDIVRGLLGV